MIVCSEFFRLTHWLLPLARRRTSTTCSSGWRRLWRPSRGSLTCSRWSLGGESSLTFEPLRQRSRLVSPRLYVVCKRRPRFFFGSPLLPLPHHTFPSPPPPPPRLEECSSEVPLLPREVLVLLGTKLWESTAQLSVATEQSGGGGGAPRPLLLVKFFIIICRWDSSPHVVIANP